MPITIRLTRCSSENKKMNVVMARSGTGKFNREILHAATRTLGRRPALNDRIQVMFLDSGCDVTFRVYRDNPTSIAMHADTPRKMDEPPIGSPVMALAEYLGASPAPRQEAAAC